MENESYVACPFCRGAPDYHFAQCPMHDPQSCSLCGRISRMPYAASERAA